MKTALMIVALLACATAGACAGSGQGEGRVSRDPTLVILVRHGEKEATGADPGLTAQGRAWANELAGYAAQRDVRHVISTPFRRTIETATPTAEAVETTVTLVGLDGGAEAVEMHADAIARRIEAGVAGADGGAWLVVGHSNTVPAVIRRLGGRAVVIEESQYGQVFTVELSRKGSVTVREEKLEGGG